MLEAADDIVVVGQAGHGAEAVDVALATHPRLLGKLGVRSRVQAVVFAYESGTVRPGDPAPSAGS